MAALRSQVVRLGRGRIGGVRPARAPVWRRLLSLVSASALATGMLALAWAGPMAPPARAGTTGGPCHGCVFAWGDDSLHQTDLPPLAISGVTAISASGKLALALTWDGKVAAWGDNLAGQATVPAGLSNVVAISSGGSFAVALKSNGSVVAWGSDSYHQTEVPAAAKSGVVAVSAGLNYVVALKSDGSIVAWGDNSHGSTTIPLVQVKHGSLVTYMPLSHLKSVSAAGHVLGVRQDGTVAAWGWNNHGQTNVPSYLSGVTAVAAGLKFSLALGPNGSISAWGDNAKGELNVPCALAMLGTCKTYVTGFSAIAAGDEHALALKNGKLYAWGDNTYGQTAIGGLPSLNDWVAVAAGSDFSLALMDKPSAPSAPANVTATPGSAAALVTWEAPSDDGGAPITSYQVIPSPGGEPCTSTNGTACIVSGLTNGLAYKFTVKAHNGIGWGPASSPSAPVTPTAGQPISWTFRLPTPTPSAAAGSPTASSLASGVAQGSALASAGASASSSANGAASASPGGSATRSQAPGPGGSGGSSSSPLVPIVVGLAVVALAGAAALVMWRRRTAGVT